MLSSFVWLALRRFDHRKAIRSKAIHHVTRLMKPKVESHWHSKEIVDMNYFIADVKCKKHQAPG